MQLDARSSEVRAPGLRPEVGGSIPSARATSPVPERLPRKWAVRLRERHLCATGVYLVRWRLETPWFSIRLHHWLHGDDERAQHDHPWDFYTWVLRGGYIDLHADRRQPLRAGMVAFRPAHYEHSVHLDPGQTAWTLVLTGPIVRRWGFWRRGKWIKSNKYFLEEGPHPCD